MRSMHLSEGAGELRITIRLLGVLQEACGGVERLEVEIRRGESLLDLLRRLPARLRNRVLADGGVAPDLLILVDGVELSCLGPAERVRLEGAREIVLIPVIHGG